MLPPDGRFTVSSTLPNHNISLPDALPISTLVYVHVSEAGNVSATVEPGALLGPAFEAKVVYVTMPPGTAVVTPSVFVIPRLAWGVSVSMSVAELLPGVESVTPAAGVTVAVLHKVPVAAALIEQFAV